MGFEVETKICKRCGKEKELHWFRLYLTKNNQFYYESTCTVCTKLQHRYDINEVQYEIMLKAQNRVCAICGQPETAIQNGSIKPLSVDHIKGTRRVRGLLCDTCNHLLGNAKDDTEILKSAIAYLERNQ